MSRIILMAITLAVTVAGCNRFPDLTIQVTANLAPDETNCTIEATQDTILLRGLYDLNAPAFDYFITPRIDSYLVDNSLENQAVQTNFQVTGFDITIKLPDGSVPELSGDLPNPYMVTANAVIPPSDSSGDVSSGAAAAPAIPQSYRTAIVDLLNSSGFNSIVIDVRANGETSGGFSQQSPPFSWPIDFCEGCLGGLCEQGSEGEGTGCFPGQDIWPYCAVIVAPTN
ncbi:MAG: hypothetical protein JRE81_07525 [Deltaproteobacteria bacterium]|jgi:hypothetical protein|nr:hypothetical protein [Deltaproteobacteria bacterium]